MKSFKDHLEDSVLSENKMFYSIATYFGGGDGTRIRKITITGPFADRKVIAAQKKAAERAGASVVISTSTVAKLVAKAEKETENVSVVNREADAPEGY